MRIESKFIKDIASTFAARIFTVITGIFTGIIAARWLGPHDRGIYALVIEFPTLILSFIILGYPQSIVYFLRKEKALLSDIVGNTIFVTFITGITTLLCMTIFKEIINKTLLNGLSSKIYYIVILFIPLLMIKEMVSAIYRANENFNILNIYDIIHKLFQLILTFIILITLSLGLYYLIISDIILIMISVSVLIFILINKWNINISINYKLLYKSTVFGLKSYVQNLLGMLQYRIDIFIIAAYLTSSDVAFYSIGVGLCNLISYVPDSIGTVLFTKLSGFDSDDKNHNFTALILRNTLFIVLIPGILIILLGKLMIRILYGTNYLPAYEVVPILMGGTIIMGIYKILGRSFTSRNKQHITIVVGLIGTITNIILNILIIPKHGIVGAAYVSTITYSLTGILLLIKFQQETNISFRNLVIINKIDLLYLKTLYNKMKNGIKIIK